MHALAAPFDPTPPAPARAPARVVVDHRGRYFLLADGRRIDLTGREVLRRLLRSLARARLTRASGLISLEELVREVWPGERGLQSAFANRVRVGIATLRSYGLREHIRTRRGHGYALAGCQVREEEARFEDRPRGALP